MQVGWSFGRDQFWGASCHRNGEDSGATIVLCVVVADCQHRPIEGQHVVIVVPVGEAGVDVSFLAGGKVEPLKLPAVVPAAAAIVDQCAAIGCPVGRFERFGRVPDNLPVATLDIE